MINPIALGETVEFILPQDKEDSTIWLLGAIDSILKTKLESSFMDISFVDGKVSSLVPKIPLLEQNTKIVQFGLKGFRNFMLNGKEVPCKIEKLKFAGLELEIMSEETIKYIPRNVIVELANEIWKENQVTEEEEKN